MRLKIEAHCIISSTNSYALPKQSRVKGIGAEDGMWQNTDLADRK